MPVPFPLEASNTPVVITIKNVSRHCQMSPGGQNHVLLRSTDLDNPENIKKKVKATSLRLSVRGIPKRTWKTRKGASSHRQVTGTTP